MNNRRGNHTLSPTPFPGAFRRDPFRYMALIGQYWEDVPQTGAADSEGEACMVAMSIMRTKNCDVVYGRGEGEDFAVYGIVTREGAITRLGVG